ncbi:MAG: 3-hydroxyanthranilate 3,4-dioxygenase, partial [Wenzhouxiangella sp.]
GIQHFIAAMLPPINFQRWIEDNRHLLKPPVGNKCIYDEDFIVMVVGGPNERTDYHFDEGPEFFYQLEGDMILKLMEESGPRDVRIGEGEIFYLPPKVPHSPQRLENTVGLVIERKRLPHELDGLMWFCPKCHHKLYEEYFELESIETQFPPVINRFKSSEQNRTCERCGTLHPA